MTTPNLCRRRWLLGAIGFLPIAARSEETALPRPASLPAEADAAARRGAPLVVLVSLPGCPFCERIRRSHLLPMLEQAGSGFVQLDLGSSRNVVDFDGATKSHESVIGNWGARFAPTLLFLGPGGKELAERLVGAGLPDFYGAYLEQRIQTARSALSERRSGT